MLVQSVMLAVMLVGLSPRPPERDNPGPEIKDFNERVQRYWDLHKKVEKEAPPINKKKDDPEDIIAHERALAGGIRAARANAKEGDIFTEAVQKTLVATIQEDLKSGKGAKARAMILGEGNPKNPESRARVDLVANGKYPSNAPLSTVPPSVLLKLPKLPEGLEYRFVGRHLILYDSKANLIVDILRNAIR
jgi:hypothetical protein